MDQRDYMYFLSLVPETSPLMLRRLLSLYGGPEAIYRAEQWPVPEARQEAIRQTRARLAEALKKRDQAEKEGIFWISCEEEAYPHRLRNLGDAPLGLFIRGSLPPEEAATAGIVGARNNSPYGRLMAERFGAGLGEAGLGIISGMARGIDGYAQEAALKKGGASFAVLGCGVDICYPAANRRLYEALAQQGGIISEYPPGTPPLAHHFPLRNRLIAALSDVLLVIEARAKSGSLITVDYALEQGKEVLAMPGRVGDELSAGCLELIRQGAGVLTCCGDVYEALGLAGEELPKEQEAGSKKQLSEELLQIWRHMGTEPVHIEELLEAEPQLGMGELSLRLLKLEGMGYIRSTPGGGYIRL